MRKNRFVIGVVLGMSLAVAAGSVEAKEAKEKQFHASFAGTDTYKDDFSFTGTSAIPGKRKSKGTKRRGARAFLRLRGYTGEREPVYCPDAPVKDVNL